MTRHTLALLTTLTVSAVAACDAAANAPDYKIVVHVSRSASGLSRARIAGYFLKQTSEWPDGTPAVAVDLSATSAVRAAFSREILGRSLDGVLHYWQQQVLSGRSTPPRVRQSEEDLLAFIASTPGGIGYVAVDTPVPAGVRVVTLAD